jgi:hypothetical protein
MQQGRTWRRGVVERLFGLHRGLQMSAAPKSLKVDCTAREAVSQAQGEGEVALIDVEAELRVAVGAVVSHEAVHTEDVAEVPVWVAPTAQGTDQHRPELVEEGAEPALGEQVACAMHRVGRVQGAVLLTHP